jgi:hypothetical protein
MAGLQWLSAAIVARGIDLRVDYWPCGRMPKAHGENHPFSGRWLRTTKTTAAPGFAVRRHTEPCGGGRCVAGEWSVGTLRETNSSKTKADTCGVRTHALSDWRLKPAP